MAALTVYYKEEYLLQFTLTDSANKFGYKSLGDQRVSYSIKHRALRRNLTEGQLLHRHNLTLIKFRKRVSEREREREREREEYVGYI